MESLKRMKERSDMILEPLQVMIQLGILSFCPVGTKLSISSNILYLQEPSWTQGVLRWYMKDNKDDLYYLFQAIRRYFLWYKPADSAVFKRILDVAVKGIKRLMLTYEKSEKMSIKHTLTLYSNILNLDNPELFRDTTDISRVSIDNVFQNVTKLYNKKILSVVHNSFSLLEMETNQDNKWHIYNGLQEILKPQQKKISAWIKENLTC